MRSGIDAMDEILPSELKPNQRYKLDTGSAPKFTATYNGPANDDDDAWLSFTRVSDKTLLALTVESRFYASS